MEPSHFLQELGAEPVIEVDVTRVSSGVKLLQHLPCDALDQVQTQPCSSAFNTPQPDSHKRVPTCLTNQKNKAGLRTAQLSISFGLAVPLHDNRKLELRRVV